MSFVTAEGGTFVTDGAEAKSEKAMTERSAKAVTEKSGKSFKL